MITLVVQERRIPFGNIKIELKNEKYVLHSFQEIFYSDLRDLPSANLVVAPTGAGKTFAFLLPVIYAKNHNSVIPPRGLIVAPTNALVEDMYRSFKDVVKVEKITGRTLQKRGIERPKELIDKVKSAEVIITNPDIVNFVIHGGYHIEESGKRRHILNFQDWTEFLGKIDYVIFDEYHLYDEEQIANLLIWFITSHQFFKNIRWFFVSATPEPTLLKLLDDQKIDYKIVRQELVDFGRVIQGKQKISFIEVSKFSSLYKWMFNEGEIRGDVKSKISETIKNGRKVFLLFDSLREAKMVENKMRNMFREAKIGVNTGFETRQKDFTFNPKDYDIIITTSKAEVGVNYPVQVAFIDSGRYLRNFLQRIGRIGRRDEESEIYCITPVSVVERIKKLVKDGANISYYEFIEILNQSFEDIVLKEERISVFMGALLWSVYNALESHYRKKIIYRLIEKLPYSKILFKLDKVITEIKEDIDDEEVYKNLNIFWNTFKRSFMRFREDTIQWKIFYKNHETEYDVAWVLDNAFVEEINRDKKEIIISDFRPKKEKIVRGIVTQSLLEDPYTDNNLQKIGGLRSEEKKEWDEFLHSDHVGYLYIAKLEKWLNEVEVPKDLGDLLRKLSPVYSKKRIGVVDILYDSSKIDNGFII